VNIPNALADKLQMNESMRRHTYAGIGGRALYFVECINHEQVAAVQQLAVDEALPVHILGGGSNILVSDTGVDGFVVKLDRSAFGSIAVKGRVISAGGGAMLQRICRTAAENGLAGLESLAGIPGTVGGGFSYECRW